MEVFTPLFIIQDRKLELVPYQARLTYAINLIKIK